MCIIGVHKGDARSSNYSSYRGYWRKAFYQLLVQKLPYSYLGSSAYRAWGCRGWRGGRVYAVAVVQGKV